VYVCVCLSVCLSVSAMWGHRQKVALYNQERWLSPNTGHTGTLTSDFKAPDLRFWFCCLSYPVYNVWHPKLTKTLLVLARRRASPFLVICWSLMPAIELSTSRLWFWEHGENALESQVWSINFFLPLSTMRKKNGCLVSTALDMGPLETDQCSFDYQFMCSFDYY
jgi:hypothetical protein